MIHCPSLPSIAWPSNPFSDLSSKQIQKIGMVVVAVLIGIGIVLAIIAVAGIFGALPWLPIAILSLTLSVLLIAGICFAGCEDTPSLPATTPAVVNTFDQFVQNLFAGQWEGARASSITNPLTLFDAENPLPLLEYGHTDTDDRWISLVLKQRDDTYHYILIETSISNTWAMRPSTEESFGILQDQDTQFLLKSIQNHHEVILG